VPDPAGKLACASTVEEIEAAIEKLSPEDFRRLAAWIKERDSDAWDKQIEEDARTGRLDRLYERLVKEDSEESEMPLNEFLDREKLS